MKVEEVVIQKVKIGNRLRQDFSEIEQLAASIEEVGLLNPVTIDIEYNLIAGERRIRALQLLGVKTVAAHIVGKQDKIRRLGVELAENNYRQPLTDHEISIGLKKLLKLKKGSLRQRFIRVVKHFFDRIVAIFTKNNQ